MPSSNFSRKKPAYQTIFEFYQDIVLQCSFFLWRIINDKFFTCVTEDNSENEQYRSSLKQAKTFNEWNHAATRLDILEGYTQWAEDPKSSDYDWKLLQKRINEIGSVRELNDDRKSMIFALKLSLSRNLGDMGNPKLYTKSRTGTKKLISDYTDTVIEQLNWIGDDSTDLTLKEKHDYFMSLRQGYGRTALLLSGGGTLGFFHIGVLKTMINARLLPRIISGASTGSIMASMICTLNEQDRIKVLNSPWSIPLKVFERPEFPESLLFRVNRYLLEGNLYDPNILKSVLIGQFGDTTFQEAYNKSRLILNITVSSSSLFDMPRVLNYITAPDVVVWSSVLASCSVPLFYPAQEIYMKTKTGKLIPWTSTVDKYRDGSIDNDLPLKKVSELFSVNNFIVVQLNPHVAPFLHKSHSEPSMLRTGFNFFLRMVKEEFQHRFVQLKELGISPNAIMRLENVLSQRYLGDITIAPELSFKDVSKILSNPDFESANNFIERGERATWPMMTKINYSLKIELAIDAAIYKLRSKLLGESPKLPLEVSISKPYFPLFSCSGSTSYLTRQMSSHSTDSQSLSDYQSTDDEEEVLPQLDPYDEFKTNRLPSTPMMPPTPLWQVDDYEKQLPIFMEKNKPEMTSFASVKCRPSLLPHDISRRGSNLSIRDISPSTSTKFERRKQITSTQFFISPDFEWRPDTSDKEFRESISVATREPTKSSFSPQKRKNLSIMIPK